MGEATLTAVACASCHATFALTANHLAQIKSSGETFYCPSGHANVFRQPEPDDELTRLRLELARAKRSEEEALKLARMWHKQVEVWSDYVEQMREVTDGFFGTVLIPRSLRTRFALNQAGYYTLEQIADLTDEEVLAIHNVGPGSLAELRALILRYNV